MEKRVRQKLRRSDEPLGYWLGDEFRPGFPDDPAHPIGQRLQIAGWGRALAPDELDPAQWDLLKSGAPAPSEAQREAERLARYDRSPYWRRLNESQRELVRDPALHRRLRNATYPLSASQLATLTGVTADQIRRWHDAGLLPARRTSGGHRRFYAAAATRAFFLAALGQRGLSLLADLTHRRGADLLVGISAVFYARAAESPTQEHDVLHRAALDLESASDLFEEPA